MQALVVGSNTTHRSDTQGQPAKLMHINDIASYLNTCASKTFAN
jgi:hypothetical protein